MQILEMLDYIKSKILAASPTMTTKVADIEISPPNITEHLASRRNYPCINIWENGYTCLYEKTMLQGKIRQWKVNISITVKNGTDEILEGAYAELVTLEDEISGIINDLSGTDGVTGATQEMCLRGQEADGSQPIQLDENIDYYLVMRVTEFIIETVEIT